MWLDSGSKISEITTKRHDRVVWPKEEGFQESVGDSTLQVFERKCFFTKNLKLEIWFHAPLCQEIFHSLHVSGGAEQQTQRLHFEYKSLIRGVLSIERSKLDSSKRVLAQRLLKRYWV